jgi:RNA polymerase sigma-70 factor (ECF subfamily)
VDVGRTELLVRLLSKHQDDLFRYIFALLPHEEDAKDVLQETCVALYRKFEDYDAGKPFLAWAFGFAFLEILKQRDRSRRGLRYLSQGIMERLASDRASEEPLLAARLAALDECLKKLGPADRELVRLRYQAKSSTDELVSHFGPSRRTLFRNLGRIRRLLFDCVTRRVAAT